MSLIEFVPEEERKKIEAMEQGKKDDKVCLWRIDGTKTEYCYSKSVVTSWLQKSIRRGNWKQAAFAALILVQNEPWYFWRRIRIIAIEDVMSEPSLFGAIYGLMREFEAATGYKLSGREMAAVARLVDLVCRSGNEEMCNEARQYLGSLTGYKTPVLNWDAWRLAVAAAVWLARAKKDRTADAFLDILNESLVRGVNKEWIDELAKVPEYVFDIHFGRSLDTWVEYGSETENDSDEYAGWKEEWRELYKAVLGKEGDD